MWRLHGVMTRIPAQGVIPEQVVTKQILKAPKQGTPYAEYWPVEADARWIALLSPAVAPALERLLRDAAKDWEVRSRIFTGQSMEEAKESRRFAGALALAKVLLGGEDTNDGQ